MRFFPLILGIPRPRHRGEAAARPEGRRSAEEAWRESLSAPPEPMKEVPAEGELRRLMAGDRSSRPSLILGEPGAGKTSLLEHWHETWLASLDGPRLGLAVPVLVRLRDVQPEALRDAPDAVADCLWRAGAPARAAAAKGRWAESLGGLSPRLFTPVWLLDGLDEFPGRAGEAWLWEAICALPGAVVLTCRTAIHQQIAADVARYVGRSCHILSLKPGQQQEDYLATELKNRGKNPGAARGLVARMNGNPALRPLAASPLLLGLVAEMAYADGPELDSNRAAFYRRATAELWNRKLGGCTRLLNLRRERDAALAALAARTRLEKLIVPYEVLDEAGIGDEVRKALRRAGLLKFDDAREQVEFPHLSFQEFHLARSLMKCPLDRILEEYWAYARYEETLALRLALAETAEGEGRAAVEQALLNFTRRHREQHAKDPSRLWKQGRSPMRVALRLVARGGLTLKDPLLGVRQAPALLRLAIAADPGSLGIILAGLSEDACPTVRRAIAINRSTPRQNFSALSIDKCVDVRRDVAGHWLAPPDVLARLAKDPDRDVRRNTAGNPNTPPDTLAELAKDRDTGVRRQVAGNRSTPEWALYAMASCDPDYDVCVILATNPSARHEILTALRARGREPRVRPGEGLSTPPEVLAALAVNPHRVIRASAARNPSTPPAVLARLAYGPDKVVRRLVMQNPSTPPGVRAMLAKSEEELASISNAADPLTRPEQLAALAHAQSWDVRCEAARNPSTLLEDLWSVPLFREPVR